MNIQHSDDKVSEWANQQRQRTFGQGLDNIAINISGLAQIGREVMIENKDLRERVDSLQCEVRAVQVRLGKERTFVDREAQTE